MSDSRRILAVAVLVLSASAIMTGCGRYEADIPEYTTGDERDGSFTAATYERPTERTEIEVSANGSDESDDGITIYE